MLIHPNEIDHKYRFLEQILPRLKPFAWFGTLSQYGSWWAARDQVEVDLSRPDGRLELRLTATDPLEGLALELPAQMRPSTEAGLKRLSQNRWLLDKLPAGTLVLELNRS